MTSTLAPPTPRQLSYLKALAARTASSFAYPATRADASREIERLRSLPDQPRPPRVPSDPDDPQSLTYATAVHDSEVVGYGSCASWRAGSPPARAGAPSRTPARTPVRASPPRPRPRGPRRPRPGAPEHLGSYAAADGERELLAVALPDGCTLVLDSLAGSIRDARVVGRIAPDEPAGNARLLGRLYLADPARGRCRALHAADLAPACSPERPAPDPSLPMSLRDRDGRHYAVGEHVSGALTQLRWARAVEGEDDAASPVSLREVVGALEAYEPARAFTLLALSAHAERPSPCTRRLREELARLDASPIVLNRGLREAVQRVVGTGVSMSEIAARCGRLKRDRAGSCSGETSWLARRVGLLAEGGQSAPTPWIHSDTLALIAREGLGVSPNEVEL